MLSTGVRYQEVVGDLWVVPAEWRVITTNGFTTRLGRAVMGRGVALQAKNLFPELPNLLGIQLEREGNIPHVFEAYHLVTLPVKPQTGPNGLPGYLARADLTLIEQSLARLVQLPLQGPIAIPRPGCGAGGLTWESVQPIVVKYLDERFVLVHPNEE